jgi:hypothetical protein
MKAICIYHEDHFGSFLSFISMENGNLIETVNIPTNYLSGVECVNTKQLIGTFVHKICMSGEKDKEPTIGRNELAGDVVPKKFKLYRRHFRTSTEVIRVLDKEFDPEFIPVWNVTVECGFYIHKSEKKFKASKDTFRMEMEKKGFNMKGWCTYKRCKTSKIDFLKQIIKDYKGLEIINFIEL